MQTLYYWRKTYNFNIKNKLKNTFYISEYKWSIYYYCDHVYIEEPKYRWEAKWRIINEWTDGHERPIGRKKSRRERELKDKNKKVEKNSDSVPNKPTYSLALRPSTMKY